MAKMQVGIAVDPDIYAALEAMRDAGRWRSMSFMVRSIVEEVVRDDLANQTRREKAGEQ